MVQKATGNFCLINYRIVHIVENNLQGQTL